MAGHFSFLLLCSAVLCSGSASFSDVAVSQQVAVLCTLAGDVLTQALRLDEQIRKNDFENKRAEAMVRMAVALTSELDTASVIKTIIQQVPDLLDSDRCTLFFVDKKNQELIIKKGSSQGRQSQNDEGGFGSNDVRLPLKAGIAGSVATTRKVVNIPDVYQDKRFDSSMDKKTGYKTRSMLCMPLVDNNKDEVIGVLQVLNKSDKSPQPYFSKEV